MANIKSTDKQKIERLFEMGSGYVLDFSNNTFQQFMKENAGIDIYSPKYEVHGDSKANRLRSFFELESDQLVGKTIIELIEHWMTSSMLAQREVTKLQETLSKECQYIAIDMCNKGASKEEPLLKEKNESEFLDQDFGKVSLSNIKLEAGLIGILQQRIDEIQNDLNVGASLSAIFLCGSVLEGILLGIATSFPQKFNQAIASPKDKETDKVLPFYSWTLNDMINVAHELGFIGLDVKRFSHVLRDFRNFIHPYEQWRNNFNPDKHTAIICWQVLRAAIHDISKTGVNS